MNIEIISTRNIKLKETGFGSLFACEDVSASLINIGHSVLLTVCETLDDLARVVSRKPDLLVLAAKYMPIDGENDVWFSEYFEQHHIICSGSDRETLRYDSNKVSAKARLASLGIKTAKHFMAIPGQYRIEEDLPFSFPLFLKPMDAANGNGIDDHSFVESFAEFELKVMSLYGQYQQPVLVEEYLAGKEYTVAVIKSSLGKMTVSAIEIIPPVSSNGLRILGAIVKTSDSEMLQEIEVNDIGAVKALAAAAFVGLGVRGFGRIDIKMDAQGLCYFMEANLVPGMNHGTSYFPRACEIANQMPYDEVICMMLDECVARASLDKALSPLVKPHALSCAVSLSPCLEIQRWISALLLFFFCQNYANT